MRATFLFLSTLLVGTPVAAQQPAAATPPSVDTTTRLRPADVAEIDSIISALYAAISGPKDAVRDWPRFRPLFIPGARLIPTGRRDGRAAHRVWTVDEYIATAGPTLLRNGFYEREIGRKMERFGNVAHLMSAYESRFTPQDPKPFQRGVNSIQLFHDGQRWWIVTVFWDSERPDNPIPASLGG
jgi:hypothetical protein